MRAGGCPPVMTSIQIVLILKFKPVSICGQTSQWRTTAMKYTSQYKTHMFNIYMILVSMLTVSLTGTAALSSGQSTTATAKEKSSLPTIDTTAPSKFEIASFGLG